MSEDIKVEPTPIQRNRRDVAVELTSLYLKYKRCNSESITEDKIEELYKKYYKADYEIQTEIKDLGYKKL